MTTQDVSVRTICQATVEEEWIVRLTDEQAARLQAAPYLFEDLLTLEQVEVVSVQNVDVYNEEDREVRSAWPVLPESELRLLDGQSLIAE